MDVNRCVLRSLIVRLPHVVTLMGQSRTQFSLTSLPYLPPDLGERKESNQSQNIVEEAPTTGRIFEHDHFAKKLKFQYVCELVSVRHP